MAGTAGGILHERPEHSLRRDDTFRAGDLHNRRRTGCARTEESGEMSKAKTNALDALRALIAERQQYEQWLSALDAKKEGTPEHVFERVRNDYSSRLDRVVGEI